MIQPTVVNICDWQQLLDRVQEILLEGKKDQKEVKAIQNWFAVRSLFMSDTQKTLKLELCDEIVVKNGQYIFCEKPCMEGYSKCPDHYLNDIALSDEEIIKKCNCSIDQLFNGGCKCGGV